MNLQHKTVWLEVFVPPWCWASLTQSPHHVWSQSLHFNSPLFPHPKQQFTSPSRATRFTFSTSLLFWWANPLHTSFRERPSATNKMLPYLMQSTYHSINSYFFNKMLNNWEFSTKLIKLQVRWLNPSLSKWNTTTINPRSVLETLNILRILDPSSVAIAHETGYKNKHTLC